MMDARVIDLAINEGRKAARRLSARFDLTPADQEEVTKQAGAQLEHTLSEWGYGPAVIEHARVLMADAFTEARDAP